MCAVFIRYIFGDGCLYTGDGERKGEGKYRGNQLVDSHALCAEYIGQKDPVKEADQAADKPGQREDGCSGNQGVFPFSRHRHHIIIRYGYSVCGKALI